MLLASSQNSSPKPKLWQNQYENCQNHNKTKYQYCQNYIKTKIQDQKFKTSIGFGACLDINVD